MKGFGIRKDGSLGWIEKDDPVLGPYDALIKPLAVGAYSSDVYYSITTTGLGRRSGT
mgnify:CR=1 FL=1